MYDPVGGDFAEQAFRSIAWRGRYLVVGFAAGPIPACRIEPALLKGASIVGVFWGEFAKREPKANAAMMGSWRSGMPRERSSPSSTAPCPWQNCPPHLPTWARAACRANSSW